MVRKREDGRWEGRIVVGHKENGEPIFRYVLAKTQKELLAKLHRDMDIYQDMVPSPCGPTPCAATSSTSGAM